MLIAIRIVALPSTAPGWLLGPLVRTARSGEGHRERRSIHLRRDPHATRSRQADRVPAWHQADLAGGGADRRVAQAQPHAGRRPGVRPATGPGHADRGPGFGPRP